MAALAITSFTLVPPAAACSWNPVMVVGLDGKIRAENYKERQRRELHYGKIAIREHARLAQQQVADGTVDYAAELALLLVPNIRTEDQGWRSSCGRSDGEDWATKSDIALRDREFGKAIANDPEKDRLLHHYEKLRQWNYRAGDVGYPEQQCNIEFRARFRAFLLQRNDPVELQNYWLFLKPRNRAVGTSYLTPMREFDSDERKPPTTWDYGIGMAATAQLRKWDKSKTGVAFNAALAEFWDAEAPSLNDSWKACPEAMKNWNPAEVIREQITEREARVRK